MSVSNVRRSTALRITSSRPKKPGNAINGS
jgi:hypothetical protein